MQKQQHLNTFIKGQVQDVDKLQLANTSYLRSEGGRVVFNEDGTYAWENAKGTKIAFNLTADYGASTSYKPTGGWQINGKLVIFSINESTGNSEIGLVNQPQFGTYTYQTIFNDKYDPYGDLLNFSLRNQMRDCQVDVENNLTERIYFNDNFNEPRVFNILSGAAFNYAAPYPSWYSVHGMAKMIDLTWGKLKYQNSNLSGNLLSGEYQYAYRYIHQSGYTSPWSPLTSHILLSSDTVSSNWTEYQMQASGTQTSKGIQLELKYIDQRFQQVEVAALYWETETTPKNAYIFFKGTVSGSTMTITHQSTGSAITKEELIQRYTEISKAKTGNIKDNTYHLANFSVFPQLEIDTSVITVEPQVRPMLSDETTNEVETLLAPPFTNQSPKTTTITENLAANLPEVYDVANDYINYKGTQWCALFKGLYGGEIYPYAIVVFDRKGQPFFAQHISDFQLPQRYSNEWTDTRLVSGVQVITTGTTGSAGDFKHTNTTSPAFTSVTDTISTDKWYLNLLGLKFSGIDLTNILYDSNGDLQVSGFSIVRTDRIKQILGQGLIMSAGSSRNNENTRQYVVPCPTMFNGYINGLAGFVGYPYITYMGNPSFNYVGVSPIDYQTDGTPQLPALESRFEYPGGSDANPIYSTRTQVGFFECPDYLIDNSTLASKTDGDNMKLVGVCVKAYGSAGMSGQAPWSLTHDSFYQKNYRTVVDQTLIKTGDQDSSGTYNQTLIGDPIDIDDWYPSIRDGQPVYGGSFYYNPLPPAQQYMFWGNNRYIARQVAPTCLFTYGYTASTNKTTVMVGVVTDDENGNPFDGHGAYLIANYIRPVGAINLTESLLQNRVYQNTGHFVPINQDILDTLFAAQGNYIFNDVSVWGGDCFLDYWTYQRLYPYLTQSDAGNNQDYGIGLSFPIESSFNIALRQGNTLERFGAESAATFYSPPGVFQTGVYYLEDAVKKLETFDINSVLQAEDNLSSYPPKPSTFVPVYDYPVREAYTGTKIYGELNDTYRKFPVNNFRDADGSKGEINSLQYIFNYLYIIQRNGFARVRFNDRETITGQTGSPIDIGNALGLQGFDYINPIFGTQHQFSVVNTGRMIHWVDAEKGKHLRFAADGLMSPSEDYGHHNYFTNKLREYWTVNDPQNLIYPTSAKPYYDNPAYAGGIVGVFDFKNQSVYYTFTKRLTSNSVHGIASVGTAETIEYSEKDNQYKGFLPATPTIYYNFKENVLSADPNTLYKVYTHDEGVRGQIYGAYVNSKLKFVVNPTNIESKWYDNGSVAVNERAASAKIFSVTGTVEDMPTQTITFPTDTRWKYLQGLVRYPLRGKDSETRLRGKSCVVEITVTNDASNQVVRISNHVTDYRLSPKL